MRKIKSRWKNLKVDISWIVFFEESMDQPFKKEKMLQAKQEISVRQRNIIKCYVSAASNLVLIEHSV